MKEHTKRAGGAAISAAAGLYLANGTLNYQSTAEILIARRFFIYAPHCRRSLVLIAV